MDTPIDHQDCAARLGDLWCCRNVGHAGPHRDGEARWSHAGLTLDVYGRVA